MVESSGNAFFIIGQRHALGQNVGDDVKPLQAKFAHQERPLLQSFLAFGGPHPNVEGFRLDFGDRLDHKRLQLLEERRFRQWRYVEQHHRAVAIQHGATLLGDRYGQRLRGQLLRGLEGVQIQSIPNQQSADANMIFVGE